MGDNEQALQVLIQSVINGEHVEIGARARQKVMSDFSWEENLPIVGSHLEDVTD